MSTQALAGSRDRLLAATASLIYRDGVGIGVEALCRAAGVSKRSMYQLFSGKDELLAASLERLAADRSTPLLPGPDGPNQPRERILYVFRVLQERAAVPAYRGCPYLAVQVELKDESHAASKVAARVKRQLTTFFRDEAERGGAAKPDLLARQLTLVFDGASARAGIKADSLEGLVLPTVVTLLDAAGMA